MPNYYKVDIDNCEVSVRPKGIRECCLFQKLPLKGGWCDFVLSIKNGTDLDKEFQYQWFLNRKHNGGDTPVDNRTNMNKLPVAQKKRAIQDITSKPLVFPGQHFLIIQAYGKREVLMHFEIPEADKTLRTLGEKLIYIAVGAAIGTIVTMIIQWFQRWLGAMP